MATHWERRFWKPWRWRRQAELRGSSWRFKVGKRPLSQGLGSQRNAHRWRAGPWEGSGTAVLGGSRNEERTPGRAARGSRGVGDHGAELGGDPPSSRHITGRRRGGRWASRPGLTAAGLPTRAEQSRLPSVGVVLVKTPRLPNTQTVLQRGSEVKGVNSAPGHPGSTEA